VRADWLHALDVWQWTLRLEPRAGLALQIAALFHDVERLATESKRRIEQDAPDYAAFKRAHAREGARMVVDLLADRADEATLDRVSFLVRKHESPDGDSELSVLNDADALSFFSLNSPGFLNYYGAEHTRMKIDYSLRRLRTSSMERLSRLRLESSIARMVLEHTVEPATALGRGVE
jgi:hypothetical protein